MRPRELSELTGDVIAGTNLGRHTHTVYVEKFVHGGFGLGKLPGGKLVLVEGAYPTELVKVEVTAERSDVAFARTVDVLQPAAFRRKAPCRHFGECGGCQIMDISYEEQLRLKREIVADQLRRLGRTETEVRHTIESDLELGYRSKMEFSFSFLNGDVVLGLKKRGSNEIVGLKECPVSPTSFSRVLEVLPDIVKATKVRIYNPVRRTGTLKHLVMRYSHSNNQTMSILVTKTETFREARDIKNELLRKVPQVNSVIHVMNSSDEVVLRGPYRTLHGSGVLEFEMDYEKFQVPPTAFFQSNFHVAARMVDFIARNLGLDGHETVLDLYAGVGTFTMRLAMLSKKVVAVESSRIAVKAGRANANINNLRNVVFYEANVLDFLRSYEGRVDVILLDPPRSGAGREVCDEILKMSPSKIVYVSCDPATLARDLGFLGQRYQVQFVQPFDMFPHSYHVESVAFLVRR